MSVFAETTVDIYNFYSYENNVLKPATFDPGDVLRLCVCVCFNLLFPLILIYYKYIFMHMFALKVRVKYLVCAMHWATKVFSQDDDGFKKTTSGETLIQCPLCKSTD